jgi:hypothetical protein
MLLVVDCLLALSLSAAQLSVNNTTPCTHTAGSTISICWVEHENADWCMRAYARMHSKAQRYAVVRLSSAWCIGIKAL